MTNIMNSLRSYCFKRPFTTIGDTKKLNKINANKQQASNKVNAINNSNSNNKLAYSYWILYNIKYKFNLVNRTV